MVFLFSVALKGRNLSRSCEKESFLKKKVAVRNGLPLSREMSLFGQVMAPFGRANMLCTIDLSERPKKRPSSAWHGRNPGFGLYLQDVSLALSVLVTKDAQSIPKCTVCRYLKAGTKTMLCSKRQKFEIIWDLFEEPGIIPLYPTSVFPSLPQHQFPGMSFCFWKGFT